jgi:hypothetical protein
MMAASLAGTSAFFRKFGRTLVGFIVFIAYGFYQSWRLSDVNAERTSSPRSCYGCPQGSS